MDDYISRAALIKTIEETPFTMSMCVSADECNGMNRAKKLFTEVFKALPAADVRPVVHSCWIELDKGFYVCGNCRNFFTQHKEWSYCPWCGAKMDGGKQSE